MAEQIKRVSELPTTTSTDGLYTLGVDAKNEGVKIPLGDLLGKINNKKKNKDFVMTMTYDKITTDEGAEFNLVDTEWDALADIVSHGECDIVLSDGIRNAYQLDHVFLSDGMPFGYKILPNNRTLNIATVIDSASSTLKLVWKFNDGAVTYDDLGGKPIVLQFKLDADGNRIPYEGIAPTAYIVEGATYEELKQAYQSKRPLYLFNNVGSLHSLSLANITAGLIPLTYQVDKMEEHTFYAHGTDGISGAEGEEFVFIGGYTIMGNIIENGEFVLVCYYGSNIVTATYDNLDRKPKINGVELSGNKTSQDLKLQGALRTSTDLALSDNVLSLTDMAKKRLFIDLWDECAVDFGRYNEETGYFELNGITDLTWDDALIIFELSAYRDYPDYTTGDFYRGINLKTKGRFRTNLAPIQGGYLHKSTAYQIRTYMCSQLEVLNVMQRMPFNRPPFSTNTMFTNTNHIDLYYNGSLRKIMGVVGLNMSGAVTYGYDLPMLEDLRLRNITRDYKYLYRAPKLNYASVKYMIENRGGTNAITIWYHANVYNKILGTADDAAYASSGGTKEEWMALADLAASKNITLATE